MTEEQKALREAVATICGGNYIAADAAIAVVLERAAKVADEAEKRDRQAAKEPCDVEELAAFLRGAFMSRNIAAAIRALIPASSDATS